MSNQQETKLRRNAGPAEATGRLGALISVPICAICGSNIGFSEPHLTPTSRGNLDNHDTKTDMIISPLGLET